MSAPVATTEHIDQIIRRGLKRMASENQKPGIPDYLRLVQMAKVANPRKETGNEIIWMDDLDLAA